MSWQWFLLPIVIVNVVVVSLYGAVAVLLTSIGIYLGMFAVMRAVNQQDEEWRREGLR